MEAIAGLRWRAFERADLPAIARFYAACEAFDRNPERHSLAGLEEFWDSPRSCPDEDTLLGVDDANRVVATAWAGCNRVVTERRAVYLGGAVHPSRRGEGIGRAMHQGPETDGTTRLTGAVERGRFVPAVVVDSDGVDLVADIKGSAW